MEKGARERLHPSHQQFLDLPLATTTYNEIIVIVITTYEINILSPFWGSILNSIEGGKF